MPAVGLFPIENILHDQDPTARFVEFRVSQQYVPPRDVSLLYIPSLVRYAVPEMNPDSQLTVYVMVGLMGSGKSTLALKIAREKGAMFQSLDGTIKSFNEPVGNLEGYERLMSRALDLMFSKALQALKSNQSVVFDVGRLPWIIELAKVGNAKIEVYHFEISREERWRRVQKRNEEKVENVYHWTMSKEEFDAQGPHAQLPSPMPGLKIIKINE